MGNSPPVGIRTSDQIVGTFYDREHSAVIAVSKTGIEFFHPGTGANLLSTPRRKRILINSVDFSPTESQFITGDQDGSLRVYEVRPAD